MYKISIIVPIYGVEKYLAGCLDSIYSQVTQECEVILVDDESPDRCPEICEEYKAKYPENTTVIHQENMGLGGARNTGIDNAAGEYLLFIDSDDSIPEGTVSYLLEAIERHGADVFVFPFRTVSEDNSVLGVFKDSIKTEIPISAKDEKACICCSPSAWNKLFCADLFKKNSIRFPSRVWYEDIRTTPKLLAKAESVVYLDRVMYNYLQREGSIMSNSKIDRNVEIIEALEDLEGWFRAEGLYEEFSAELEYLVIDHVFVSATVRVLRGAGAGHPLVKKLREYTQKHCASMGADNKYVNGSMPKNRKLIYSLLKAKLYFAVSLVFKIKG